MNNKYYGFGILLLAVLFTPLSAQNDTIEDYLKENKVWSVNRIITGGLAYRWMDILWFEGEEEKDGYVWKRYYTSRKEDRSDAKLSGWMRQEGRKVYTYLEESLDPEGYDSSSKSLLLFDFGLEEGDTVVLNSMNRLVAHRVFDSVFEEGRGSRRCIKVRLTTVDPQGPEVGGGWDLWVEGFGSIENGISIPWLLFSGSVGQLLCVQDEEGYQYQNDEYQVCFIPEEAYMDASKVWSVYHTGAGSAWTERIWFSKFWQGMGRITYYVSHREDGSDAVEKGMLLQHGRRLYRYDEKEDGTFSTRLLFDFLLQQGDTAVVGDNDTVVADRVFDSVFVQGQPARHCISVRRASSDPQSPGFHPETDTDLWVEGIGSLKGGITVPFPRPGEESVLLCMQLGDSYAYRNPDYPDCFIPGEEETRNETVHGNSSFCRVVNTAGGGEIAFLFSEPLSGWIQVFDMQGQCLLQERLSGEEHRIGKLAPGTYVYRVLNVNRVPLERGSGKFISL